ncbi:hypothetical protein D9M68_939610 [compost metagenome]
MPKVRLSSAKRCTNRLDRSGSTLPVGSSASSTFGRAMTARAMAARCFSPPDSSEGRAFMRSPRPTHSSSSVTLGRYSLSGCPKTRKGRATFSKVVR